MNAIFRAVEIATVIVLVLWGWALVRWCKALHRWCKSQGEMIDILRKRQDVHWARMDLHEDFIANLHSVIGHPFKRPNKENAK